MASTYYATNKLKVDDKVIEQGDTVSGLDSDVMQSLFESGSVTTDKAEAAEDREYPTTPRVVADSLKLQAASKKAPGGKPGTGALTQPQEKPPGDPEKLLTTEK